MSFQFSFILFIILFYKLSANCLIFFATTPPCPTSILAVKVTPAIILSISSADSAAPLAVLAHSPNSFCILAAFKDRIWSFGFILLYPKLRANAFDGHW